MAGPERIEAQRVKDKFDRCATAVAELEEAHVRLVNTATKELKEIVDKVVERAIKFAKSFT
jgi:hypothetical protein